MKQKITKGKVVQNCLKVTAAVALAGGVGFQFHEISNLNSELETLKDTHKLTVQELKIANQNIITAKELEEQLVSERDSYLSKSTDLEKQVGDLTSRIGSLEKENKSLKNSVSEKEKEISNLKTQRSNEVSPRSVNTARTVSTSSSSGTAKATYTMSARAYTTAANGDPNCSGAWGNLTASGTTVKQGRTIAVDPRLIPLGSKVRLTFPSGWEHLNGVYVAEDTGNAIKGHKIDVYFDSYNTCIQFGKRTVKLEVL